MNKNLSNTLVIIIVLSSIVTRHILDDIFIRNIFKVVNLLILIGLLYINRESILKDKTRVLVYIGLLLTAFTALGLFFLDIIDIKYMMPILMTWVGLVVIYSLYGYLKKTGVLAYIKVDREA